MRQYIVVREEPKGRFVAYPVGLPELTAVANDRADAVATATCKLNDWIRSGQLVPVRLPGFQTAAESKLDSTDAMRHAFEEAIQRSRRDDLAQTLAEYEAECPGSSLIPIT
ncbi:MAG TPA: hypothetical protein VHR66_13190 [Gemmataceae bacterium]|jgi:hypothetical protein|nr:hypothetical protein [Gemmataceae bacterium]